MCTLKGLDTPLDVLQLVFPIHIHLQHSTLPLIRDCLPYTSNHSCVAYNTIYSNEFGQPLDFILGVVPFGSLCWGAGSPKA